MLQRRAARLVVQEDARGRDFAALFAGTAITVDTTPDITTALWQKLVLNSGGILTAATGNELDLNGGLATANAGIIQLAGGTIKIAGTPTKFAVTV